MKNLTLNDQTQTALLPHLAITETLLARAVSEVSGRATAAEIVALPDLGMPHNVTRARGGFFTGALYRWQSDYPFVPIDATVNVDTVSAFRIGPITDEADFRVRVGQAKSRVVRGSGQTDASNYVWNHSVGNHFISYGLCSGTSSVPAGSYLFIHSSASEFKYQHNGLYPCEGNWFWESVHTITDPDSGRFLRYIAGPPATRFIQLAQHLVEYNRHRHRYIAGLIAGQENPLVEFISVPHYGMPSEDMVAIGCQWAGEGQIVPLLTGPNRPILFIKTDIAANNFVVDRGRRLTLFPHGLGKMAKAQLSLKWQSQALELNGRPYRDGDSFEDDPTLVLRDIFTDGRSASMPDSLKAILQMCPGEVVGRIDPLFSYARGSDELPESDV